MRPSHEKTPLWQPKRGLDVLISRPPRQAGIPIKPWIQGAGCLWQRTCNYKTSVLRWILCSKKLSKSRLSAQFLSLHKNLTRRAAKQLRTTQPHTSAARALQAESTPQTARALQAESTPKPRAAARKIRYLQADTGLNVLGTSKRKAYSSMRLRTLVGSTLMPGPIVEEIATVLTYLPLALDGLTRIISERSAP